MKVFVTDGKTINMDTVVNVERGFYTGSVHDFNVPGYHNFAANGILVHNSAYAWRGAQPSILREDFEARWPGVARFNLPINYRSTREIVGVTAALIGDNYADSRYLKPFDARGDAPDGGRIGYSETEDFDGLAGEVATAVKETPGDWFVLSRTRAECAAIHTALVSLGIPAINKSGGLLFGAPHVRKVLAYARLACDYHGARDDQEILREIANVASAEFRAPMTRRRHLDSCRNDKPWINCGCPIVMEEGLDYSHARFYGQKAVDQAGNWAGVVRQQDETNRGGYPTVTAKGARDLVGFVERIDRRRDDARTALNAIIEGCVLPWLKAEDGLADEDLAENGKAEDFSLLVNLAEPDENLEHYLDRVEELSRGGIEGDDSESVLLGTIHWSKGAERPRVVVNMTRLPIVPPEQKPGQLPTGRPPTMEEERRLLFVAMTRAQEECRLIGSLEWNNQTMERSEFVQGLIDKGLIDEPEEPEIDGLDEIKADHNDWLQDEIQGATREEAELAERGMEMEDLPTLQDVLESHQIDVLRGGRTSVLELFPPIGRFEDTIYRPSARELCGAMPGWEPTVDGEQLVLVKPLGEGCKVKCYTSILLGRIAGGVGEDSIRVVREDAGKNGKVYRFKLNQDWVTRQVPKDADTPEKAAAHIAGKIEGQVAQFTRPCPECGLPQVLCRAGKGRDQRLWWRGLECRCPIEDGW
ncbi:MAG: 3'-5' exonuclease [Acidobacteriota bacterium]